MWWDRPAPTLTTNFYNWGSGRFGHPGYHESPNKSTDRAISLLEGAILQTFPTDYEFVPENEEPTTTTIGRLIGNAVPVRLAKTIGGSIRHHLTDLNVDPDFTTQHQRPNHTDPDRDMQVIQVLSDSKLCFNLISRQNKKQRISLTEFPV
jgi:hypothetical protein